MIISTVKDYEDNLILVEYIKNSQKYLKDIILILMSHQAEEALDLYDR